MNQDLMGLQNLNFLGNFVAKEMWNKPLPGSLDPVFCKMIQPKYLEAYKEALLAPTPKPSSKNNKKRKSDVLDNQQDGGQRTKGSSANPKASEKSEESLEQAPLLMSSGYSSLLENTSLLFFHFDHFIKQAAKQLKNNKTLLQAIFVQFRDAITIFCVEKCLGDGVLKATVKSFLSCIFQNLSLLDALMEQLHNVLNTALNSGMEMELLFLLCWSCTMFEFPSSPPTTSTQSPQGEHFSDNFREIMRVAPTVDDSHRLVHVLKDRQQILTTIIEQLSSSRSSEETLTQLLTCPYFLHYHPSHAIEVSCITRGEILCRISSQWEQRRVEWKRSLSETQETVTPPPLSSRKRPKPSSSNSPPTESAVPKKVKHTASSSTAPPSSIATATATTTATAAAATAKTQSVIPPPKRATATKTTFPGQVFEEFCDHQLNTMSFVCPLCVPSAQRSMSWHRFVEHMRGLHNEAADVHRLNELVAIALSDDVAITKRIATECLVASPAIFIRCTDCRQLCFGRQGLIRHRGQCSQAIPFEVKYAHLLGEPTDHVFITAEKGEIEWFASLVYTYVGAADPSSSEGSARRQRTADEMRAQFVQVVTLLRDANKLSSLSPDKLWQMLQTINSRCPGDAIQCRGQVYDSIRMLMRFYIEHSSMTEENVTAEHRRLLDVLTRSICQYLQKKTAKALGSSTATLPVAESIRLHRSASTTSSSLPTSPESVETLPQKSVSDDCETSMERWASSEPSSRNTTVLGGATNGADEDESTDSIVFQPDEADSDDAEFQ